MTVTKKNKVLRRRASVITVQVSSPPSNDPAPPNNNPAKSPFHALYKWIPGVMNPHSRRARYWSKFFIFFFLFAFLLQTLYIFLQHVKQDKNCIGDFEHYYEYALFTQLEWTNIIYLLHIAFKFRVAYVDPKSRVLVYNPKKVALNYLFGYFTIDLLLFFPWTQRFLGLTPIVSDWSYEPVQVLSFLQYLAVLCRLLSLFADQATGALFFESWSSKFALNLLAFFLFSHVVGSFWYNFALDRVDKCLRKACGESWCFDYIYCEPRNLYWEVIVDATLFEKWTNNKNATACFSRDAYDYGIYVQAVSLMKNSNLLMRYIYSLFWGFQQISTLAGNQIPAFFLVEVLFTMFVTATGLLLFSFLIGNIQNFLQALGRRSLENSLRRSDIEQWMSHRQLPEDLKAKIRESEQYNWLATKGLNELMLLENLPEDLQRDIRRHLFKFDNKLPIVASMDESIKDAIRERMKHNTYIEGSRVLVRGGLMDKMVYIVQGKLESTSEGENVVPLSEGDVCGAELITLCLEHYVLNRDGDKFRIPAGKLVSKRTVRCITNVEAFTLRAADLEDVFSLYSGLLIQNPLVQGAITKESLYPKSLLRSRSY
ncbi:probable cyclic nucleotide-gated ion channel 20, chloroplastic [Daucus carota subsp. sativus]|uniref:probable cyclic nucleotide-gated ion channel 20, chloroplastic n=1 Tax=Daucus carota subsp. sativus TaxID=79200 RepID=UPI0007EF39AA|nr:PREDICTED: probable cyclic nucleotide-gated ion channel 20, chloroplastic [Daucus carota subsp. sativus]